MSIRDLLDLEPFYEIQKYNSGLPSDAVAFVGSPRKHPYDSSKIMLFTDLFTNDPLILEFRLEDILCAEDLPSPVTEDGKSYRMLRLWMKRGALGIKYVPFEIDTPLKYCDSSRHLHERILEILKG